MLTKEIFDIIESVAPLELQAEYDNSGLQVGSLNESVSGIMLCLDVTAQVLRQAQERGCNLVISHHPLIFKPVRRVSDSEYLSSMPTAAIESVMTV